MTKKELTEAYGFLSMARMGRLSDEEKIAFMRLLRAMKPVAVETREAMTDAMEKALAECGNEKDALRLAEETTADVFAEEVEETYLIPAAMMEHLVLSNDWNFAQIDALEQLFNKKI